LTFEYNAEESASNKRHKMASFLSTAKKLHYLGKLLQSYKRYKLKIVLCVINIVQYMPYGQLNINTVTPVAPMSITCYYA